MRAPTCQHTLGPLLCTAGAVGHPYGHVYQSTSGIPDCPKEEM